jgi:MSHA biogenesis protein MshJ
VKEKLLSLAARVDALTLRERVLLFAAAVAIIGFVAHFTVLGPMLRKHDALRAQINQQENNIAGIDAEITASVQAYQVDPDAPARTRLAAVQSETAKLGDELRAMQHGLVAPERMSPLLEAILRANARLQLVSMRTLAVEPLSAPPDASAKAAGTVAAVPEAQASKSVDLLYRHGVEVTVRGRYLDMVDYMSALEAMPSQLFWGKAELTVEEYPTSRLTLTLYTLSLDRKWMML